VFNSKSFPIAGVLSQQVHVEHHRIAYGNGM